MNTTDLHGNALSSADADARDAYAAALHQLQCYIGDPLATIRAAVSARPGFVMGHILDAYLNLLGTEPFALEDARSAARRAATLPMNEREARHLAAIDALTEGRWIAAGRILEDIAIDHPRDALALQAGHLVDFYCGDARMLRDRIARAMPAWDRTMPCFHALLGMAAFGLEETGDYARAESLGRRAVETEPRDGWAQHAVAHVMEMRGRRDDGIEWMSAAPQAWADESFFAVHNWWHLALFRLEADETDRVLELFDGPIFGARSKVVLDLVDASALLWRLMLRGVPLGDRWSAVADNWTPLAAGGNYAFNDTHAMMALASAGRTDAIAHLLEAQERAMRRDDDNAMFTAAVGRPVALAIRAYVEGDFRRTIELLRPVRNGAARFGGSHAQRDLLDLTMIEAAWHAGERNLARALASERLATKPASPHAHRLLERTRPAAAALAA